MIIIPFESFCITNVSFFYSHRRYFKYNEKEGDNEFDDNDNDDKYSEDCFIGEK